MIERVRATANHALQVVSERDRNRQRAENEVKLFPHHEVGERADAEVFAKRRDEIGKWERPDGVDDARNRDERDREEVAEGTTRCEINQKRSRAESDADREPE